MATVQSVLNLQIRVRHGWIQSMAPRTTKVMPKAKGRSCSSNDEIYCINMIIYTVTIFLIVINQD